MNDKCTGICQKIIKLTKTKKLLLMNLQCGYSTVEFLDYKLLQNNISLSLLQVSCHCSHSCSSHSRRLGRCCQGHHYVGWISVLPKGWNTDRDHLTLLVKIIQLCVHYEENINKLGLSSAKVRASLDLYGFDWIFHYFDWQTLFVFSNFAYELNFCSFCRRCLVSLIMWVWFFW